MQKSRSILKNKGFTAALVAIWLLLSFVNTVTLPQEVRDDLSAATEQTSESNSEESDATDFVVKASEAVQSTISFNLDFQSFLLEEIERDEDDESKPGFVTRVVKSVSKQTRVLLEYIISRNAP
jgi:hypothetical protein